ncbi:MAG: YHS domain-containing protein [Candidatus Hadarchaeota archaeon]
MAKDPVCGMTVDEKTKLTSSHGGNTYCFCSPACKSQFDKNPEKYVKGAGAHHHAGCCC